MHTLHQAMLYEASHVRRIWFASALARCAPTPLRGLQPLPPTRPARSFNRQVAVMEERADGVEERQQAWRGKKRGLPRHTELARVTAIASIAWSEVDNHGQREGGTGEGNGHLSPGPCHCQLQLPPRHLQI